MRKTEEAGIYEREDGRLVVRATAKCPDTGKMKEAQRTLRHGQTMADAVELRESLKEKLSEPAPSPSRGPQITTVADYAAHWIKRKSRRWKPSTTDKNEYALSWHILPDLGHIRLDRLTRKDVADWIARVETKRQDDGRLYSSASVKGWWTVLRNMLRDAYAQGHMPADITTRHTAPDTGEVGRQEQGTLSADELGRLAMAAAATLEPQRYAEIVTLAYTGMRAGELYGLHWDAIDEAQGLIHIKRSAYKGEVGTTKTGKVRTVPMAEIVRQAIAAHRQEMIREQHPGLSSGIVFPDRNGGYRRTESLSKPLRELGKKLGFEVHVSAQVLRRTFNTLLIKAQVDRITIRSLTGHSSERMTEHYTGLPMEMKRQALGTLLGTLPETWDQQDNEE